MSSTNLSPPTIVEATPDDEVAARLRVVIARLSRRLKPTEAAGDPTSTEVEVLGIVGGQAPSSSLGSPGWAGLNPTMLSRIVGKLEDQGLFRRLGDDTDGRVSRLELTAAGRRLHDKVRKERTSRLAHELEQLSPPEREAIEAVLPSLERLAERLLDK